MARVKKVRKKVTKAKGMPKMREFSIVIPRLRLEPMPAPTSNKKNNKDLQSQKAEESSRFFEGNEIGENSFQGETSYKENQYIDRRNYEERNKAFDEMDISDYEENMNYEMAKPEIQSSAKSNEIKESSYHEEMEKVKIAEKKSTKAKVIPKMREFSIVIPRLRLEPMPAPTSIKKNNKDNQSKRTRESSRFFEGTEIGETSYKENQYIDRRNYEERNKVFGEMDISDYEENMNYEMAKPEIHSSAKSNEIKESSYHEEMAKVKIAEKKSTKAKVIPKMREFSIVIPRLRLEPRSAPTSIKKNNKDNQSKRTRESSRCLEGTEIGGNSFQAETSYKENQYIDRRNFEEQGNEAFDEVNSDSESEFPISFETLKHEARSTVRNNKIEENCYSEKMIAKRKQWKGPKGDIRRCGLNWNDKELMDLANGLQTFGFADLKKIADFVKTKTENEVRHFLNLRRLEIREEKLCDGRSNRWGTRFPRNIASWPNVRKWKKLAYEQMMIHIRSIDYSKSIITSLCKKFYEEEEEPADPQVINVKLVYKYMMDCMAGEIPPQLPPKESALVLHLLQEVRSVPSVFDFEEERKFLKDFKASTKFKPFQVKDEFKKRYKKEEPEDDILDHNIVPVPGDVFLDLSRHKKLVQSCNPLGTPAWMLQKEQSDLEKYAGK